MKRGKYGNELILFELSLGDGAGKGRRTKHSDHLVPYEARRPYSSCRELARLLRISSSWSFWQMVS